MSRIPDNFFESIEKAWQAVRGPRPKITVGPKICAHCEDGPDLERGRGVLVAMLPGYDGVVWFLCVKHWNEGYKAPLTPSGAGA